VYLYFSIRNPTEMANGKSVVPGARREYDARRATGSKGGAK